MESKQSTEYEYIIELPYPVSVNAMNRVFRGRPVQSRAYKLWQQKADALGLLQRVGGLHRLESFTALILLCPPKGVQGRADVDNRIKVVLDWAQRVGVIDDDRHCTSVTARWDTAASAPEGCRLILRGTPVVYSGEPTKRIQSQIRHA